MKKIHSKCDKNRWTDIEDSSSKMQDEYDRLNAIVCIVYLSYDMSFFMPGRFKTKGSPLLLWNRTALKAGQIYLMCFGSRYFYFREQIFLLTCAKISVTQTTPLTRSQGRTFNRDLVNAERNAKENVDWKWIHVFH